MSEELSVGTSIILAGIPQNIFKGSSENFVAQLGKHPFLSWLHLTVPPLLQLTVPEAHRGTVPLLQLAQEGLVPFDFNVTLGVGVAVGTGVVVACGAVVAVTVGVGVAIPPVLDEQKSLSGSAEILFIQADIHPSVS